MDKEKSSRAVYQKGSADATTVKGELSVSHWPSVQRDVEAFPTLTRRPITCNSKLRSEYLKPFLAILSDPSFDAFGGLCDGLQFVPVSKVDQRAFLAHVPHPGLKDLLRNPLIWLDRLGSIVCRLNCLPVLVHGGVIPLRDMGILAEASRY